MTYQNYSFHKGKINRLKKVILIHQRKKTSHKSQHTTPHNYNTVQINPQHSNTLNANNLPNLPILTQNTTFDLSEPPLPRLSPPTTTTPQPNFHGRPKHHQTLHCHGENRPMVLLSIQIHIHNMNMTIRTDA